MKYVQHYCHRCGHWRELVYLDLCRQCADEWAGITHASQLLPAIDG